MSRVDETVVSDKSQASQLLHDVLRGRSSMGRGLESRRNVNEFEFQEHTSPHSSMRSSIPNYHLHGLANTQSQTQHDSRQIVDSQEENARAPEDAMASDTPQGSSSLREVQRGDTQVRVSDGGHSENEGGPRRGDSSDGEEYNRPRPHNELSAPSRAQAFRGNFLVSQSPQAQGTKPDPASRYAPRQKQSTLHREDSFAGQLPAMDQANAFMRNSDVFCKPLFQLGVDTQDDSIQDGDATAYQPMASPSPNRSPTSLPHSLHADQPNSESHPRSSYFVPDSDNSQDKRSQVQSQMHFYPEKSSQSQPLSRSQSSDFPGGQGHPFDSGSDDFRTAAFGTPVSEDQGYEPTESTDSYRHDTEDETQPAYEPTQPTTDSEDWGTGHPVTYPADEVDEPTPGPSSLITNRTNAPSAPQGVASMVNPAKKWRMRGAIATRVPPVPITDTYMEDETIPGTTQGPPTDEPTQPAEPTQLTDEIQLISRRRLGNGPLRMNDSLVPDSEAPPRSINASYRPTLSGPSHDWRASEPCDVDDSVVPTATEPVGLSHIPQVDMKTYKKAELSGDDDTTADESVVGNALLRDKARKEEEESDDEVPLSSMQPRKRPRRSDSAAQMPPPQMTADGKRFTMTRSRQGRSPDIDVIPSSDPQQDFPKASTTHRTSTAHYLQAVQPTKRSPECRPVTPVMAKPRSMSPLSSENETVVSGEELPKFPDKRRGDTEPADEESIGVEQQKPAPVVSRKRKRGASSSKANSKASGKLAKVSSVTPAPQPAKRLKTSSTSRSISAAPTRVFALWKADASYYSGLVYSQPDPTSLRYLITFDDNTEDTVEIGNMRQCTLFEGDSVLFIQTGKKARVISTSGDRVTIRMSGGSFDRREVHVRDLRVAAPTVKNAWDDRRLTMDQIVTVMRPKTLMETPSRASLASAGSSKSARKPRMLSGIGLVVTLSPNNEKWETERGKIADIIKNNDGTVLEDWSQLFQLEGNLEKSGRRWVALKEDVTLLRSDLENVFLISDAHHQKPKYLIALALGIPCVSSEWLQLDERELKLWQPHLLPAGFSVQLHYRMSQTVNLDWGDEDRHLERIMHNLAPPKIFAEKSILYISPDFTSLAKSSRKNRKDAEQAKEANRAIPKILLCMGASRVEAVAVVGDASQALKLFDYVVVKEPHEVEHVTSKGVNCVHFKWVKDCLVAGRLLPHGFDYLT